MVDTTTELDNDRIKREELPRYHKEDVFKLVTNLKKKVKNALWVAGETMEELE